MRPTTFLIILGAALAMARPMDEFIGRQNGGLSIRQGNRGGNNNNGGGRGRNRGGNRGGNNNNNAGAAAAAAAGAGAAAGAAGAGAAAGGAAGAGAAAAAGAGAAAADAGAGAAADAAAADAAAADAAAADAAAAAAAANVDPQVSLTLDPGVISAAFANDGQDVPSEGQVASLTSTNNFINFCLTVDLPLTNGAQVEGGSCNPAPMGVIGAKARMPASKFVFPPNGGTVAAGTPFTIEMAIQNLETGNFVNAASNYFSAPQQINAQGIIKGHSHVVIQALDSLDQTTVVDPTKFVFFKGLNAAAVGGILTADVGAAGLTAGAYRLSSINTAANHQPVLVAVAQHGALDDAVYFTVA